MTAEVVKRVEYGLAEARRIEEMLKEATRIADNVTSVVNEVAAAGNPLHEMLSGTAESCKARIDGALLSLVILTSALASLFSGGLPIIPLAWDKSELRFGIDQDLSRAVKATKTAQRTIYADSYGDERVHYTKAVSRALTILEGVLRQIRAEESVT